MATKTKTKSASKRTTVKNLKSTKELSGKSMKKIKGGNDPMLTVRKAGKEQHEY
jgi:hypothetical protein